MNSKISHRDLIHIIINIDNDTLYNVINIAMLKNVLQHVNVSK